MNINSPVIENYQFRESPIKLRTIEIPVTTLINVYKEHRSIFLLIKGDKIQYDKPCQSEVWADPESTEGVVLFSGFSSQTDVLDIFEDLAGLDEIGEPYMPCDSQSLELPYFTNKDFLFYYLTASGMSCIAYPFTEKVCLRKDCGWVEIANRFSCWGDYLDFCRDVWKVRHEYMKANPVKDRESLYADIEAQVESEFAENYDFEHHHSEV